MSGWIRALAVAPNSSLQDLARGPVGAPFREDLAQPVLEAVAARPAQAAGEGAVGLGGVGHRVLPGEQLLDAGVVGLDHVKSPIIIDRTKSAAL